MKTMKTLVAAAVLIGAPGLAMAEGCNYLKERQANISCAPGTTFDASTGTCVAEVSS
ncbi:MAG: adenylosuccinate lyase [Pseudomonadota bacterium]